MRARAGHDRVREEGGEREERKGWAESNERGEAKGVEEIKKERESYSS